MQLRPLVLGCLVLCCAAVHSQEPLRPAVRQEYWASAAVQGRLPGFFKGILGDSYKRIRMRNELGYRSSDVFFAGRQTYLDVNLRYKISDLLSVAYEHRFATRSSAVGLQHRSIVQAQRRVQLVGAVDRLAHAAAPAGIGGWHALPASGTRVLAQRSVRAKNAGERKLDQHLGHLGVPERQIGHARNHELALDRVA